MENNKTQNIAKTHRKPPTIRTNNQKPLPKKLKKKNIRQKLDQQIPGRDNKEVMSTTITKSNFLKSCPKGKPEWIEDRKSVV